MTYMLFLFMATTNVMAFFDRPFGQIDTVTPNTVANIRDNQFPTLDIYTITDIINTKLGHEISFDQAINYIRFNDDIENLRGTDKVIYDYCIGLAIGYTPQIRVNCMKAVLTCRAVALLQDSPYKFEL